MTITALLRFQGCSPTSYISAHAFSDRCEYQSVAKKGLMAAEGL